MIWDSLRFINGRFVINLRFVNKIVMNKKAFRTVSTVCMISSTLLIVGCASKPTVQQQGSRVFYVPEFYTVKPGDSLSKIAAQHGLNYMDIARLNNIDAIDKIYVNQSLRLRDGGKSSPRLVQTKPVEQAPAIQRQDVLQQAQTAQVPKQVTPVTPQVGLGTTTPAVATTPANVQPQNNTASSQLRWVMPSNGRIIDRFNADQNKKGLRFGGNIGDPIYAATAGEVVYADDGLKEYGKLVLIRHTQGYITAYAHNNRLIVKVGDQVTAGQKIAEMGNTGATSTMLEFQIRLDGKPIDPLTILPMS